MAVAAAPSEAAGRVDALLARSAALHPRIIDLSLGRIERLLAGLGHPERRLPPAVHFAGTNGKGSTLAFLRGILEAAGYAVHAYTSPHLVRFNERIVLAGREIGDDALAAALETCERVNGGAEITYFEITSAAAFLAFSDTPADILLLETGLGGRLDATNVIARPRLSAISPVALDHQHYLGDTLAEIATEKAGILKPGVTTAVGPQPGEAARALENRAVAVGAPLYRHGRDWRLAKGRDGAVYESARRSLPLPALPLAGAHQAENAGLAVACADLLSDAAHGGLPTGESGEPERLFEIDDDAVRSGLGAARWPGRLQRLDQGPLAARLPPGWELWLDGGHNPAAAAALADWARHEKEKPLHVVAALLTAKDPKGFLAALSPQSERFHAVPVPGDHEAFSPEDLAALARDAGMAADAHANVTDAVRRIVGDSVPPGRILVCGSLYLVGSLLAQM